MPTVNKLIIIIIIIELQLDGIKVDIVRNVFPRGEDQQRASIELQPHEDAAAKVEGFPTTRSKLEEDKAHLMEASMFSITDRY